MNMKIGYVAKKRSRRFVFSQNHFFRRKNEVFAFFSHKLDQNLLKFFGITGIELGIYCVSKKDCSDHVNPDFSNFVTVKNTRFKVLQLSNIFLSKETIFKKKQAHQFGRSYCKKRLSDGKLNF
jgi:hypothetical protein